MKRICFSGQKLSKIYQELIKNFSLKTIFEKFLANF